ncbi:MAG: hypothetical protein U0527_13675 [Candidatus Eisenbacteria bacterium]
MERIVRSLAVLLLAGLWIASPRIARSEGIPEIFAEVVPWDALNGGIVCPPNPTPLPASIAQITIRNSLGNPIPGLSVVVLVTQLSLPMCSEFTGVTDSQGHVDIVCGAAGCAHHVPGALVIKANGVTIRVYQNCKSPDFDGASGNGAVGLPDLIAFAREFNGQSPPSCHDYTNDGLCNLADLTIFGPAFSRALHCK